MEAEAEAEAVDGRLKEAEAEAKENQPLLHHWFKQCKLSDNLIKFCWI